MGDTSVLSSLCRSLYLGLTKIIRIIIFIFLIFISIITLVYMNKVECSFTKPTVVAQTTTTPNPSTTTTSEVQKPNNAPIIGTFNYSICLLLNIYHLCLLIPISLAIVVFVIVNIFIKGAGNTPEGFVINYRREMIFFFTMGILSICGFLSACLLENLVQNCGPCTDKKTENVNAQNMRLISNLNWLGTFLLIAMTSITMTTYCVFSELVKSKESSID